MSDLDALAAELDDLIARCERGDESLLIGGPAPEWSAGESVEAWARRVVLEALGDVGGC